MRQVEFLQSLSALEQRSDVDRSLGRSGRLRQRRALPGGQCSDRDQPGFHDSEVIIEHHERSGVEGSGGHLAADVSEAGDRLALNGAARLDLDPPECGVLHIEPLVRVRHDGAAGGAGHEILADSPDDVLSGGDAGRNDCALCVGQVLQELDATGGHGGCSVCFVELYITQSGNCKQKSHRSEEDGSFAAGSGEAPHGLDVRERHRGGPAPLARPHEKTGRTPVTDCIAESSQDAGSDQGSRATSLGIELAHIPNLPPGFRPTGKHLGKNHPIFTQFC